MEQQPTYELRELRNEAFFSWPETEEFGKRLSYVWIPATLLVSLPIALSTYSAAEQLPAALLAANVGGSAILFAFLLRLRVGWGYVSERLNSKETYYEENGASGRGGYVVAKDAELVSHFGGVMDCGLHPSFDPISACLTPQPHATAMI